MLNSLHNENLRMTCRGGYHCCSSNSNRLCGEGKVKFFMLLGGLISVLSGDGDCNHDGDCEGSLICGNNNCNQEVLY